MSICEYKPNHLARLADCGMPDTSASPGARFLRAVRAGFLEGTPETAEDRLSDIMDSAIPSYTHPLWLTFVDLAAYSEPVGDTGFTFDDNTPDKYASVALDMIGSRLISALIAESAGTDQEDDA